jgi:hypothetical protein
MTSRLIGILFILLPMFEASAKAAESLIWKTETTFAKEIVPPECKPDDDECLEDHHISYSSISHYGRTYFLTYEEGTRTYVSFDAPLEVNPDAQLMLAAGQIAPGAFDWGGVMEGTQFKPFYVIKRFYDPGFDYSYDKVDQTKSGLYVWRLKAAPGQERSVVIGMPGTENVKARELAEKDFASLQKTKK